MLELRKAFALRVAEMIADSQKQTEMNFKAAQAQPMVNKPITK